MSSIFENTEALDQVMPMHCQLTPEGTIAHCAPTLAKLTQNECLVGKRFFDAFVVRRPSGLEDMASLSLVAGTKLRLSLRHTEERGLRGCLVPLPEDRGYLLDLSFGISVIEAVGTYGLTVSDFAPTDLTIELLYLHEAQSAVLQESRQLNARLEHARSRAEDLALTDPLTGLANRRAMERDLSRRLEMCAPFVLLHVDLDHFKEVNDTFGHAAGDAVLQAAAQVFLDETRRDDLVARVGGDEFIVILSGQMRRQRVRSLGERIIARLEAPIAFEGQSLRVSASVGASLSADHKVASIDLLLNCADRALYAAKGAGRGRFSDFAMTASEATGPLLQSVVNRP